MNQCECPWSNLDLAPYFEHVPASVFRDYAIRGGIEEGCDIDLAFPFIEKTQSVMEIGACYGRVLRHLKRKGYCGKIYAIERSQHFFELLQEQYANTVELIHADMSTFKPQKKVDALLWMWSDISGFPKDKQLQILQHLSNWLNDGGIFIIETLVHTQASLNATNTQGQSYVIESEYGTLYGYIPSEAEVHAYAKALGFQSIEHQHYFTPTGRERILHILKNRIKP